MLEYEIDGEQDCALIDSNNILAPRYMQYFMLIFEILTTPAMMSGKVKASDPSDGRAMIEDHSGTTKLAVWWTMMRSRRSSPFVINSGFVS